jgi:multisubunit Na+/H+ antiporter MnhC subunit
VTVSGIAFLVLGSLFIILSNDMLRPLFILAFIGGGVYLLMSRHHTPSQPRTKHSAPIVEENIQRVKREADRHREIA